MLKRYLLILFCIFSLSVFAQIPQGINYQAVVRNASGIILTEQQISLRISILESINATESLYSEIHRTETNTYGLINIVIGEGQTQLPFDSIDWAKGSYFVQIEMDPEGGDSYSEISRTRMLSVPYALVARTAVDGVKKESLDKIGTEIDDLNKELKQIKKELESKLYKSEAGGIYTDTILPILFAPMSYSGLATNKGTQASFDGEVTSVRLSPTAVGILKIGVGSIDEVTQQAIIGHTTQITIADTTISEYPLSLPINRGEQLFVYLAGDTPVVGYQKFMGLEANRLICNIADEAGPLTDFIPDTATFLNFEYTLLAAEFEKKTEADLLREKVRVLEQKVAECMLDKPLVVKSPDGKKYELAIDTKGSVVAKPFEHVKCLCLGNSITQHPINEVWWGVWGMAASDRSKDWAHLVEAALKSKDSTATVTTLNMSIMEIDPPSYNLGIVGNFLNAKPTLVFVRLGENVNDPALFGEKFGQLLDYLNQRVPYARVVVGGSFWERNDVDAVMEEMALKKGALFVKMAHLNTTENRTYIGAEVMGDDGVIHIVDSESVARHPGDKGMAGIARLFLDAIGY